MRPRDAATRGEFVAAACVACCAPPIIGALGVTAGIAATVGIFLGLAAAIAVVLLGAGRIAARRRGTPPWTLPSKAHRPAWRARRQQVIRAPVSRRVRARRDP